MFHKSLKRKVKKFFKGPKPEKPKPSAQEKALAEVSAKKFNDYVNRYLPAEDVYRRGLDVTASDINKVESDAVGAAVKGLGSALVDKMTLAKKLAAGSSGSTALEVADLSSAMAGASGLGIAAGKRQLRQNRLRGLARLAALGRGLDAQAVSGLTGAGARATDVAIGEQSRRVEDAQNLSNALASAAGMYLGYRKT